MADDAQALLRDGRLADALAAQTAVVRSAPTAIGARWFYAELLCLMGDHERADRMLEIIASQAADRQPAAQVFRQILRGEEIRRQVLAEGRAPRLVGAGAAGLHPVAEALLLTRTGRTAEALACLGADGSSSAGPGRRDGVPFAEFRDLDDVMARLIEIITPDGDYCWAMTADINQLAIQPLARPRDLIWRPARIEIRGGLAGEVWLPALYIGPAERMDDALRLGRRTDWIEEPDAPVRGRGLRSFLIDDDDVPIHELGTVEFDPGPAAQP